jgi:predicted Fe-Mo cluster-binding NifX family protein
MDRKTVKFAFAINKSDEFESENFCNADKFRIYELIEKDLVFVIDIVNQYQSADEQTEISVNNGNAIINLLKNHNINVLVSSIFGKNIQMVNSHFIPVIVYSDTAANVINALKKHIKWIHDELNNRPPEFRLFTISRGILKTPIKRDHSEYYSLR